MEYKEFLRQLDVLAEIYPTTPAITEELLIEYSELPNGKTLSTIIQGAPALSTIILSAFHWDNTREGIDFWADINEFCRRNNLLLSVKKELNSMKDLQVYIDVYGRVALCEKFPDDEEHTHLNDLLEEFFVEENLYNDLYKDYEQGFYMASFMLIPFYTEELMSIDDGCYMHIKSIRRLDNED